MRYEYTDDFVARFWSRVEKTATCWLWRGTIRRPDKPGRPHDGYGCIYAPGIPAGRVLLSAHRVALELGGVLIANGWRSLHTCDVRECVRNDVVGTYEVDGVVYERRGHLWLGTNAANTKDMILKGRTAFGDRNPSRLHPERLARGDRHPSRTKPGYLPSGDDHPWRRHPEIADRIRGENNRSARLNDRKVREIREIAKTGVKPGRIATMFGVGRSTILRVLSGENWGHIT